jgi:hypothetical protein
MKRAALLLIIPLLVLACTNPMTDLEKTAAGTKSSTGTGSIRVSLADVTQGSWNVSVSLWRELRAVKSEERS